MARVFEKDEKVFDCWIENKNRDGVWLSLPANSDELQEAYKQLEVTSTNEIKVEDYNFYTKEGVGLVFHEGLDLDELNYFAHRMLELDKNDIHKDYNSADIFYELMNEMQVTSIKKCIDYADNDVINKLNVYTNVKNEEDIGYLYAELNQINIPENCKCYFDFETYGRDVSSDIGCYIGEFGYIEYSDACPEIDYKGKESIPDELLITPEAIAERTKARSLELSDTAMNELNELINKKECDKQGVDIVALNKRSKGR